MSSSNLKPITLLLDTGATIPLRPATAKKGNTYFATLARKADGSRYFSPYGVNVTPDVIGGSLPSTAELLGTVITLRPGMSQKGHRKVQSDRVTVTVNEKPMVASIRISQPSAEVFNISASITNAGGSARKVATSL